MKVVSFLFGAFAGVWATVGFLLAAEVVRAYRENTEVDSWQEYHSEDDESRKSCECCGIDIDHIIWLDSVRRESQQDGADLGFNDTSDDEEI
jgi:hypothetical protein